MRQRSEGCVVLASRGFTLVELLVVIAIVAVLLAMMLPSLGASRATSKSLMCLTSERQMYGVFNQYAYDNKFAIPYMSYYWHTLAQGQYIAERGQTYTGAANGLRYRMFKCASDDGAICAGDPAQATKPMFDNPWLPSGYAMNMTMNWGTWNVGSPNNKSRLGERSIDCRPNWGNSLYVKSVSELTFMMDAPTWIWGWDQAWYTWNVDNAAQLDGSNKFRYSFRHPNETANVLYMDGHAAGSQHALYTGKALFGWKYP